MAANPNNDLSPAGGFSIDISRRNVSTRYEMVILNPFNVRYRVDVSRVLLSFSLGIFQAAEKEFHGENQWREILRLNEDSKNKTALKVLWVWPNEDNLKFLKSALTHYEAGGVTSVGCGCGLLEWIIQQYTGLPIVGFEINRQWWESKYSAPAFIPLKYVDEEILVDFNPKFALLFCYFNDGKAFREYVKRYRGRVIIIIGPHDGSGRHTNPQPFGADFDNPNWRLVCHQEIKDTKDFIAIYYREALA